MKIQKIILAALLISAAGTLKAQTNFSGTWVIKEKTPLTGQDYANTIAKAITVTQTADSITFSRTSIGQTADVTFAETIGLNSKLTLRHTLNRKETVTLTKTADGFTETATFSKEGSENEPDYQRTEVWTLAADGHTLTIIKNFQSLVNPDDKWSVKGTFVKQE
jgi:hypothetical protein